MTPITLVEGTRNPDPVSERNLAERRFSALASAVREHEANSRQFAAAQPRISPNVVARLPSKAAPAYDIERRLTPSPGPDGISILPPDIVAPS